MNEVVKIIEYSQIKKIRTKLNLPNFRHRKEFKLIFVANQMYVLVQYLYIKLSNQIKFNFNKSKFAIATKMAAQQNENKEQVFPSRAKDKRGYNFKKGEITNRIKNGCKQR